jgi:hypothetical protein
MSKNMAVLDENNIVVNIILCNDNVLETEQLKEYNNDNPATIGGEYYEKIFYPIKYFPSWVRNSKNKRWEAPTPMPVDDKFYRWDEDTTSWVEVPAL